MLNLYSWQCIYTCSFGVSVFGRRCWICIHGNISIPAVLECLLSFGRENSSWWEIFWGRAPSFLSFCIPSFSATPLADLLLTPTDYQILLEENQLVTSSANAFSSSTPNTPPPSSSTNVPESLLVTWSSHFNPIGQMKELQTPPRLPIWTIIICITKHNPYHLLLWKLLNHHLTPQPACGPAHRASWARYHHSFFIFLWSICGLD